MVAGGGYPSGVTSAHSTSTPDATTNPDLPQRVADGGGRAAASSRAISRLAAGGSGSGAAANPLHEEGTPPVEGRRVYVYEEADGGEAAVERAMSAGGELPQPERGERVAALAEEEAEEVVPAADAQASQPPQAANARAVLEAPPVVAEEEDDVWQECEHGAVRMSGSRASPRGFVMQDGTAVPRCMRPACDEMARAVRPLQVAIRRKLQEWRVAKHRGRSYGSRRMGDLFCGTAQPARFAWFRGSSLPALENGSVFFF